MDNETVFCYICNCNETTAGHILLGAVHPRGVDHRHQPGIQFRGSPAHRHHVPARRPGSPVFFPEGPFQEQMGGDQGFRLHRPGHPDRGDHAVLPCRPLHRVSPGLPADERHPAHPDESALHHADPDGYFFESWLDKKRPTPPAPITFTSGRKPITLPVEEILYVESNDDATVVYATEGRCFRNITPISRWEAILKPHFIRIHRSYLVNKAVVSGVDVDLLSIGETQLPISRKYREEVLGLFSS